MRFPVVNNPYNKIDQTFFPSHHTQVTIFGNLYVTIYGYRMESDRTIPNR